jgi:hypothetical protein
MMEGDFDESGIHEGWSDTKAHEFLDRLVQTILSNRIFPIGYGAIVKDSGSTPREQALAGRGEICKWESGH